MKSQNEKLRAAFAVPVPAVKPALKPIPDEIKNAAIQAADRGEAPSSEAAIDMAFPDRAAGLERVFVDLFKDEPEDLREQKEIKLRLERLDAKIRDRRGKAMGVVNGRNGLVLKCEQLRSERDLLADHKRRIEAKRAKSLDFLSRKIREIGRGATVPVMAFGVLDAASAISGMDIMVAETARQLEAKTVEFAATEKQLADYLAAHAAELEIIDRADAANASESKAQ
jgi:hypothetical protein